MPTLRRAGFAYRALTALTAALLLSPAPGAAQSAPSQPPAALVRVDPVIREPLSQTVPVIGRLVARQEGDVAARTRAPIARFLVRVGDRVAAGDTIALLDDAALKATLAQAEGRLREAQARIATAEAQLALARQERVRLAALKDTQATSKALYDDAVQNEAIAAARVREAKAAVDTAGANVSLASIELGYARVKAPYAGVVVQRWREEGAYANTGDPLVRMLADSDLEIEADVPFERLAGIAPGVEVSVALDDGSRHTASVRAVIPEENRQTRTRAVRFSAALDNSDGRLADGQTATVHIPLGHPREVVSVHKDGINRGGDQTSVYVVEDGVARLRPVRLGEALGRRFEVLAGLTPGDLVVVRGNERLRPGDRVRVNASPDQAGGS
jgi:RND family efflux transporter MFP subunit